MSEVSGYADIIVGQSFGDEGKAKELSYLLASRRYKASAKDIGGPNAGHTIVTPGGMEWKFHQLPSCVLFRGIHGIVGDILVNPASFADEMFAFEERAWHLEPGVDLSISDKGTVITPVHISREEIREATNQRQGSTLQGISGAAADRYAREAFLMGDIKDNLVDIRRTIIEGLKAANEERKKINTSLPRKKRLRLHAPVKEAREYADKAAETIDFIADTYWIVQDYLEDGAAILVEGSQGKELDIHHGDYPHVTSFITTSNIVTSTVGINRFQINDVYGISKLIDSKVGGGRYHNEVKSPRKAERLRKERGAADAEYGTTTGRPRQIGNFNLMALKIAVQVNGVNKQCLNKFDDLNLHGDEFPIVVAYKIDGKIVERMPSRIAKNAKVEPLVQLFPIPEENLSGIRNKDDVPEEARAIVDFIEEECGAEVALVGTGPGQDDIIEWQK